MGLREGIPMLFQLQGPTCQEPDLADKGTTVGFVQNMSSACHFIIYLKTRELHLHQVIFYLENNNLF